EDAGQRALVERAAKAGRGAVERLVPACSPQLFVLAHERRREPLVPLRHAAKSRRLSKTSELVVLTEEAEGPGSDPPAGPRTSERHSPCRKRSARSEPCSV